MKMLQKYYGIKKLGHLWRKKINQNICFCIYFCIYEVITYILLKLLGFALSCFIFRVWEEGHGTVASPRYASACTVIKLYAIWKLLKDCSYLKFDQKIKR